MMDKREPMEGTTMAPPDWSSLPTRRGLIVAAAVLAVVPPARASWPPIQILTGDLPPFSIDGGGEWPGYTVELAGEACRRSGLPFQPEFGPWTRVQRDARLLPNHLIIGLTQTPDRLYQYRWIAELIRLDIAFMTRSDFPRIDTYNEAELLASIAVRGGSMFETDLERRGFRNHAAAPSEETAARMLRSGRVYAWFTYPLRAVTLWRQMGFPADELAVGAQVASGSLYLAASLDFPNDLAERLANAVAEVRSDGTDAAIRERYFGPSPRS
jgi:polar amino acid transport system substrate-binding protein